MLHSIVEHLPTFVFFLVVLSWVAFALIFVTRTPPPKTPDRKRDPSSITGVVFQGLSYGIVWSVHRPYFTPFVSGNRAAEILLSLLTVTIAFSSVLFTMAAVKTLGKEWSLTARVVEEHKLATRGPYAIVRHPIYTGMIGMLLATGLATSYWQVLVLSLAVLLFGTIIRIRSEERLLRETFGVEFEKYAKRVSAIIPGVY